MARLRKRYEYTPIGSGHCCQCGRESEQTVCRQCENGHGPNHGRNDRRINGQPIRFYGKVATETIDDVDDLVDEVMRRALGLNVN